MIDWQKTLVQIETKDEAASVALHLSSIGCKLVENTAQEFASSLWELGAGVESWSSHSLDVIVEA